MVQIGVATDATKETSSSFAAVDLLTDEEVGRKKSSPKETQGDDECDSSSSSSAGSGSDSDSSSDSSNSDDSDDDSEDVSNSDSSDESTSSSSGAVTDVTEKHKNFSAPLKKAVRPNGKISERNIPVNRGPPPPSTFEHKKRFPSFSGMSPRKDKGGNHQRLAANEDEAERKEETTKKTSRDFKVHDPANFPLEQYTDAEYGLSGRPPETYSYSSADPNNIDYSPRSLRKMDNVDVRQQVDKGQRKIIAYGFCCTIVFCLFIMIASIVAFKSHMNVHSAPTNLADVCSMQSIGTEKGHKHCEKSCKEAECCMASYDSSCFLEQQTVCMEYSPCGTIHTNYDDNMSDFNLVVPPAPLDLEQICSDLNIAGQSGFLDCQAACNPGFCCLPTNVSGVNDIAPGIKTCWATHADVCQYYTPCKALEGVDENHGSPVDLVNLKCSVHNLKFAEGVEDCGNICQTRSCCFAESEKRNCREDNEVWCNEFAACDHLLTAPDFVVSTTDTMGNDVEGGETSTIEETCTNMAVLDEAHQYTCKQICQPASCCVYEDIDCESHIDCQFYSFCKNIISGFDGGEDIDQSPADVEIACADVSTSTGKDQCYFHCAKYQCCFHDDFDPITCHARGICNQYRPCEKLKNIVSGFDGGGEIDQSPADVEIACADVSTSTGKDQCYFHCAKYQCCFQDDFDPITCHARGICNQYRPCEKLEQVNDDIDIKSTIDDLCSVANLMIGGGYEQCEDVCAGKMCCFDESAEGCSSRQECIDHEACSMLMNYYLMGKEVDGGARFDVEKVCSIEAIANSETKVLCADICDDYSCCFNGGCNSELECSKFNACKNLPSNQHSLVETETYPKPTANLFSACSIQLINEQTDPFFEQTCIALCEPAECCRDDVCRHVDDFCQHYTPCYSVWSVERNSNLSEACADTSDIGKAACEKACEQWECCWEQDNCFSANNAKCVEAVEYCLSDNV